MLGEGGGSRGGLESGAGGLGDKTLVITSIGECRTCIDGSVAG